MLKNLSANTMAVHREKVRFNFRYRATLSDILRKMNFVMFNTWRFE